MASKVIDWSQLWYPGPKRAFSAEEMQRAGGEGPSATLLTAAGLNVACGAFGLLQLSPPAQLPRLTAVLVVSLLLGYWAARWLWWRPWRQPLRLVSLMMVLLCVVTALALRWLLPDRAARQVFGLFLGLYLTCVWVLLWFLVVWRANLIEGRLREAAERERAIEMAQRLAAAQLEPHFLYNTLASLQHWVNTQDPRASSLLAALTGYLRATLPMFSRALQPAAEELQAARLYLEVMQARLGQRLHWQMDIAPAALAQPVPPGLLLTLVENAIAHGIEPLLAGGELVVRGRTEGAETVFEVQDNGPGPADGHRDGLGLANSRERLALTCGPQAQLSIAARAGGGCLATVRLPAQGAKA